jgi:hypothetical protein
MEECPIVMVSPEIHASTVATVATVRPAVGLIFHMPEVHRTFAALSRAATDFHIVNKIRLHVGVYSWSIT